ncbi:MAG: 30S ribosomal protein S16 [Chloroflexi bacterium]|nr:30S ribosomal protein S16 [Chloroflexota bacterium]
MVRIRLRRTGMKGQASYRIVAAEKEKPRDGKFLEILGSYNPRTEPSTVVVQEDRIYHWLKNGAQPSDSVAQIFNYTGIAERYERFKAGEELDVLMAESEKMMEERNVNPRTRRD